MPEIDFDSLPEVPISDMQFRPDPDRRFVEPVDHPGGLGRWVDVPLTQEEIDEKAVWVEWWTKVTHWGYMQGYLQIDQYDLVGNYYYNRAPVRAVWTEYTAEELAERDRQAAEERARYEEIRAQRQRERDAALRDAATSLNNMNATIRAATDRDSLNWTVLSQAVSSRWSNPPRVVPAPRVETTEPPTIGSIPGYTVGGYVQSDVRRDPLHYYRGLEPRDMYIEPENDPF